MDLYTPALSRIHHEGFDAVARAAGPAIVRHLQNAGIRKGLVLDLGCGSGILAKYLVARGFDVCGIDPSAAMLAIARRVAPGATFIRGRAEQVKLPRCSAIVSTGEALTYLTGRQQPAPLLRRHIERASRAIEPGGLFMFDTVVANPRHPMKYETWRAAEDWTMLIDVREDIARHVVVRDITTFTQTGSRFTRTEVRHRVGVYARVDVVRTLREHGFTARTFDNYAGKALPPRRMVFVARRQ